MKKGFEGNTFALNYAVVDEPLQEFTADKLTLAVGDAAPGPKFEASKGVAKLNDKAQRFGDAALKRPLATLPKGALLQELGRAAGVIKVEWEKDRPLFVKAADAKEARGQKPAPVKDITWNHDRTPAQIALNVDPSQGGAVVDAEKFTLSGVVNDAQMQDLFVLVNDQKVYFAAAKPDDGGKLKFSTDFALKEGNNVVSVVSRETQDFATRKTVLIRRRPPAMAQTDAKK